MNSFLTSLFLLVFTSLCAQTQVNSICLSVSDSPDSSFLPLPESVLKTRKLFLLGENHGVAINPVLILKSIKYFYARAGMRYFIIEQSPSEAMLYNRYLRTGDESLVKECWDFRYLEYIDFWRNLYAFNKTKAEKERITVIGIDFECDITFARAIEVLKPTDKTPPPCIGPVLDSLYALLHKPGKPDYLHQTCFQIFEDSLRVNKKAVASYFGENMLDLYQLSGNKASFQKFGKRNKEMCTNFLYQIDYADSAVSWFGSLGSSHVFLGDESTFAGKLNKNEFKDKVLSMPICYDSCYSYYKYKNVMVGDNFFRLFLKHKKALAAYQYCSKHASCNTSWIETGSGLDETGILNRQCQYLIYIRKQKAVTMREGVER
ncbi:MAG: hypothetical protein ACHQRM_15445 [Bacteroidia bacterium]